MIARAPAKINLALAVGGLRPDGYHELATIFQSLELHDELAFVPADGLSLAVEGDAPPGPDNLVLRAARLLAEQAGVAAGAAIRLTKRIPARGGLGGGSSDAAATLVALDRLWGTRAGPTDLHRLAAALGSDVPFFLLGGTALGLGRGERLFALPELPRRAVVLALPAAAVPTPRAYALLDALGPREPVPDPGWDVARLWNWAPGALAGLGNDLEAAVFPAWPELAPLKQALLAAGAEHALLSGSGATVFGLFADPAVAAAGAAALVAGGCPALVTATTGRPPAPPVP